MQHCGHMQGRGALLYIELERVGNGLLVLCAQQPTLLVFEQGLELNGCAANVAVMGWRQPTLTCDMSAAVMCQL